jgi:hypothetical protein
MLKSKKWIGLVLFLIWWGIVNTEADQSIRVKDVSEEDFGRCEVMETSTEILAGKAPDLPQAPGWPQNIWGAYWYAPTKGVAFADLDQDGNLEIIAASTNKRVYVWDYLGNPRPGWPQTVIGMPQFGVAVGDVNGDSLLEIAVNTWNAPSGGRVYVFDRDGNTLPGWPVSLNDHDVFEHPTLSDLDGDGKLEIIVGERDYPMGYLHVLRYDGTEFPGNWPFELDGVPGAGAAVGDIDNDGQKEIIYLSVYSVYAFESDGTLMPGWPHTRPGCEFSYSGPALADFEGDGYLEIVCSCCWDSSGFFVLDYQGNLLPGWPRPTPDEWSYCPPSVGDVDQDGDLEIAVGNAGFFGPEVVFHLFDIRGNYLPGFPLCLDGGVEGPISIADIEGDSTMELIFDSNAMCGLDSLGFLRAAYSNGDSVSDWPLRPFGFTYMNGSTMGDVNDDGILEVSTISSYSGLVKVNLWNLLKSYGKTSIEWGTYHFDNERTGLYRRKGPNQPPQHFSLISPDSGVLVSRKPTYVWHASNNPDTIGGSVTYTLKYSLSPIFWGYEQVDSLTDTSYTLSESLVPDTIYFWRVKADDGAPNGVTWADQGFWWFKVETYVYGDADGDEVVDLADVVYLIRYLFKEDEPPIPLASGDPNNDCVVNIADIVYLLNYIFKEGPEPLQGCA